MCTCSIATGSFCLCDSVSYTHQPFEARRSDPRTGACTTVAVGTGPGGIATTTDSSAPVENSFCYV